MSKLEKLGIHGFVVAIVAGIAAIISSSLFNMDIEPWLYAMTVFCTVIVVMTSKYHWSEMKENAAFGSKLKQRLCSATIFVINHLIIAAAINITSVVDVPNYTITAVSLIAVAQLCISGIARLTRLNRLVSLQDDYL